MNENTTKADEAKQEADALEAQAAQLDSFTDFASIKEQRLAAVMAAAETRFDWERLMREVSRVMPSGQLAPDDRGVRARATRPPSCARAGPGRRRARRGPAATFVGCTPKQSEVAKILVRLRAMHRVTDVELNESLREQGVAEVTADSCGPLYKFDVTVTFCAGRPGEAPRGTSSVPASLGGGS